MFRNNEIKTQNENINNHNVNFVIKFQVLIKQWNQDLKLLQISKVHESTSEISHPYSNTTYTTKNKKNLSYTTYHLMTCNHMILKTKITT